MSEKFIEETALAALAKKYREAAGVSRTEASLEFDVARPTIFYAEEEPERGLHKLRKQIIEKYSQFEVIGPVYLLRKKR